MVAGPCLRLRKCCGWRCKCCQWPPHLADQRDRTPSTCSTVIILQREQDRSWDWLITLSSTSTLPSDLLFLYSQLQSRLISFSASQRRCSFTAWKYRHFLCFIHQRLQNKQVALTDMKFKVCLMTSILALYLTCISCLLSCKIRRILIITN